MCDLAFVNFLREKVRNQEAEERRIAIIGITPRLHFVPWSMPRAAAGGASANQTKRLSTDRMRPQWPWPLIHVFG